MTHFLLRDYYTLPKTELRFNLWIMLTLGPKACEQELLRVEVQARVMKTSERAASYLPLDPEPWEDSKMEIPKRALTYMVYTTIACNIWYMVDFLIWYISFYISKFCTIGVLASSSLCWILPTGVVNLFLLEQGHGFEVLGSQVFSFSKPVNLRPNGCSNSKLLEPGAHSQRTDTSATFPD